jgi:hypothetical protein
MDAPRYIIMALKTAGVDYSSSLGGSTLEV